MMAHFELVRRDDGWWARFMVDMTTRRWRSGPHARWKDAIRAIEKTCGAGVRWAPENDIIHHPAAGDVFIRQTDERTVRP